MKGLSFLLVILPLVVMTVSGATAQCLTAEISLADTNVGNSCRNVQPALPSCLPLNKLLILEKSQWKSGKQIVVSGPPTTSVNVIDHTSGRSVSVEAFEYLFIADSRGRSGYGLVGVLASRQTSAEVEYKDVNLFRNSASSFSTNLNQNQYRRYHSGERVRVTRNFLSWRQVPNYRGLKSDRGTKRQFLYDQRENETKHARQTLLLRHLNGRVTCVDFNLAHSNHFVRAGVRAFSDGVPKSQDDISVEFKDD